VKTSASVTRIFDALDRHHPGADTELAYSNAFELLVATMLSAQSTDARVNLVTPALFKRFPDARAMAAADGAELERLILSTGFFRQKSKSLIGMSSLLLERHGGEVPASMAALTALPGVGRKTANVVLGHALGVPGLPVDRHVLRVANRIGLVHSDDPVKVEVALCAMLPPARWTRASDTLILHGRRVCRPAPLCPRCNVRKDCDFYRTGATTKPMKKGGSNRLRQGSGESRRSALRAKAEDPPLRRPASQKKTPLTKKAEKRGRR